MCVCACRKSGTLSWRVWTKICRQQMCSCLEERRPTVWAQKLYSPMEEVEGKFANQAWMWCTSKNQFRASAGLRWCVLFFNWPTWEDHVGFLFHENQRCVCSLSCVVFKGVWLSVSTWVRVRTCCWFSSDILDDCCDETMWPSWRPIRSAYLYSYSTRKNHRHTEWTPTLKNPRHTKNKNTLLLFYEDRIGNWITNLVI